MNVSGPVELANLLLVEDDPEDIDIIRRAFRKAKIANPLYVVRDGEEAMEFLAHTGRYTDPGTAPRPQIILLDLDLPRLDGREVLRRIKQDQDLCRIPVVVLTTSNEEADVFHCYENGANTFIAKPTEFDNFLDVVKILVRYWLSIAAIPDR